MTRPTLSLRSLTQSRLTTGPALIVALVFSLLATSAQAGPGDRRGPQRGPNAAPPAQHVAACGLHEKGACVPSCGYGYKGSYAAKQYDKGFYEAQDSGYEYGMKDGLYGRRFCDQVPFRLRRHSRHYREGFLDGFSAGYEEGFEKGRKKRRRQRRHRSRRWWW